MFFLLLLRGRSHERWRRRFTSRAETRQWRTICGSFRVFSIQIKSALHPRERLIRAVASLLRANTLLPPASGSSPPSWQHTVSCSGAAETGGVNLLYRRSNRGASSCLLLLRLFFSGLHVSSFTDLVVTSQMWNLRFCATRLILAGFGSNYISALISPPWLSHSG